MFNLTRAAKLGTLIAATVAALATQAGAVPLAPGGIVGTPGTTAAMRPELAGVVVQDVLRPFSFVSGGVVVHGTLQDRVVRENQTGTLDFYYRIQLDQNSNAAIIAVRKGNFAGSATDVDWRIDGLGIKNPKAAARSAGPGAVVSFDHNGAYAIFPGQQSRFVFIKTRATSYSLGVTQLIWSLPPTTAGAVSSGAITLRSFQP